MGAAQPRPRAFAAEPIEHPSLYKEDQPRRIDRYIAFFGVEEDSASADMCGELLLDSMSGDRRWSAQ